MIKKLTNTIKHYAGTAVTSFIDRAYAGFLMLLLFRRVDVRGISVQFTNLSIEIKKTPKDAVVEDNKK